MNVPATARVHDDSKVFVFPGEQAMATIEVKRVEREALEEMGVFDWPIWSKEASTFPWTYDERESAYVLEGRVRV